jgi:SHS2 domain-containing protein
MEHSAGFLEHEHTADWELDIWAPDFFGLLEQAARGMYALSGTRLAKRPRQTLYIDINACDRESLLVKFLTELLLLSEQERLAFDTFQFAQQGTSLCATLEGAPYLSLEKEIKAVTYHNLVIRETKAGLRVNLVFDV